MDVPDRHRREWRPHRSHSDTISFMRISIGCDNANRGPGKSLSSRWISSVNSSCEAARFHDCEALRVMNKSVSSVPIGSVATSAVPTRLHTWAILVFEVGQQGFFHFRVVANRLFRDWYPPGVQR